MNYSFTYNFYRQLIKQLIDNSFKCVSFKRYQELKGTVEKVAILRHDIDLSLEKAVIMSEIEKECEVSSTYFVMCTSNYYNILENKNKNSILKILNHGNEIGLHYDETQYGINLSDKEIIETILDEIKVMETILGIKINSVSMHIPSKRLFGYKLDLRNIMNSYSPEFTKDFKYLSDSMMRWREPVLDIIKMNNYNKIQLLVHPIWYEKEENNSLSVCGGGKKQIEKILDTCMEYKVNHLLEYTRTIYPDYKKGIL